MKVRLRTPVDGFTEGELTGEVADKKHAVKLPSGKIIWLFTYEFVRIF